MNFALALVAPTHASLALEECRTLVAGGLRDLGHEVLLLDPNRLVGPPWQIITFGANMLPACQWDWPRGTIHYSFEQAVGHWLDAVAEAAKKFAPVAVWNWSERSTELLKERGVDAITVPFGYHPDLAIFEPANDRPTDVCFYGALSPRRERVLEQCRDLGLSVEVVAYGEYGRQRAEVVNRSKVVLNVHFYPGPSRLELARVAPLLASGCCVVSERSEDDEVFLVGMRRTNYENLADLCHWVVEQGSWQEAGPLARAVARRLRPEREVLAEAIEKTFTGERDSSGSRP